MEPKKSDLSVAYTAAELLVSIDKDSIIKEIIFFGSRAKGQGGKDSDYDILVKLNDTDFQSKWHELVEIFEEKNGALSKIQLSAIREVLYEEFKKFPTSLPYQVERDGYSLYKVDTLPKPVVARSEEEILATLMENHLGVGDGRFYWGKMMFDFGEEEYTDAFDVVYQAVHWYMQAALAYYKIDIKKEDSLTLLCRKIIEVNNPLATRLVKAGYEEIAQCTSSNLKNMPLCEDEAIDVLYAAERVRSEIISFLQNVNEEISIDGIDADYLTVDSHLDFLRDRKEDRKEVKNLKCLP